MNKTILPSQLMESSHEYFRASISRRSQSIYVVTMLFFVATLISLPYIKVNVTVMATGILRPMAERTEIKPLTTGIVKKIFVSEGQRIESGKPLLVMQTDIIESKINLINSQQGELRSQISDLEILLNNKEKSFTTPLYSNQYAEYLQKRSEIQNRKNKAEKEFVRNKKLFENGVIAEKEYDDLRYQLSLIEQESKVFTQNYTSGWQKELQEKQLQYEEIRSKQKQLHQEQKYSTILSPISGNIEQFTGIYTGTVLQSGQTICLVSPDTALIAEIMVLPKDIGWLSVGNKVNFQIDAFNYTDWGMVSGRILEISNDFQLMHQTPVFKVRCLLDKQMLTLNNGICGVLKKGMTLNARFFVAERSLLQLLTDKTNDWLNPAQYRKKI